MWSIVTQLREEALPFLAAAENEAALPSPSLEPSPPVSSSTGKTCGEAAGGAAPTGGAAAVAVVAAAVEHWTKVATQLKAGAQQGVVNEEEGGEGAAEAAVEAGNEAKKALASTLLVAPRLHPFNAAQFENFARTLAIALKQAPIVDRIEVEVGGRARCGGSGGVMGALV